MLVYVNIKNYKSIVNTTLDLRYGERKAPNGYMQMNRYPFLQNSQVGSLDDTTSVPLRVVPTLAIYGANACGKSTIVEAIKDMLNCLWVDTHEHQLPVWKPNRLHPELDMSSFAIQFIAEGKLYEYSFSYNYSGIHHELLRTQEAIVFALNHDTQEYNVSAIATPDYPEQRILSILHTESRDPIGSGYKLFFKIIAQRYAGLNPDIKAAHVYLRTICTCSLFANRLLTSIILEALSVSRENASINAGLQELKPYIRKFDLDIIDMEFSNEKMGANDKDDDAGSLYARHLCADGSTVLFPFSEESNGTQVLFGLLVMLLKALKDGSVVIVDEIDQSIHPHLLAALIRLFTDKENNPKGAQLIFTAHNTEPLAKEQLRVSEVGIVTKNLKEGTVIRRLCDYRGVRNIHDFQSMYLNGHFSGIPFPEI